ncbi:SDR family NAD(P)-dependent oxidoreductase [Halorussus halobius]|uniref:SDR family NAD(P)-dependent oxidoreductase n=1 Tax=Halorussus halobius TaxID=1710537 RepID=UPI001091AF51|nr:SDR family NAD(P)-dependent oxidoreductase [Halorussus halobius]
MDGLTAVVTGADWSLGGAVARRFASEGARVVVSGRDADELDELVAEMETHSAEGDGSVRGVRADVRDEYDVERLLETAARESDGGVDVVAACAETFHGEGDPVDSDATETPLSGESYAAFDDTLRTNARGAFATIREAVPHLAGGARVLVAGAGERERGGGSYAISKAAATAVARGFAAELDAAVGVVDARSLADGADGNTGRGSDAAAVFAWAATEAAVEDVDGEVVGRDAFESAEA